MLRLLLVIDDYNELVYLETILKKLGFDVEGLQNDRKYEEAALRLNPRIVLCTAKSPKVDGLKLSLRHIRTDGWPRFVFLKTANQHYSPDTLKKADVFGTIDSPVSLPALLDILALAGELDRVQLEAKFQKIKASLPGLSGREVSNESQATPRNEPASGSWAQLNMKQQGKAKSRDAHYQQLVAQTELPTTPGFDRQYVAEFAKKLRETSGDAADLDRARMEFAEALIRAKRF